jgi:general secretion pathway protein D
MRKCGLAILCLGCALLSSGCPKGNDDFKQAKKAELLQDYDTALIHYQRALKSDPANTEYKLKTARVRFEAGQHHVRLGQKALENGDLQTALAEFQKAMGIDPSSPIAQQEVRQTLELIASKRNADEAASAPPKPPAEEPLAQGPAVLKPISRAPINFKATTQAKTVYETIAKLAGVTVTFDPDFPARTIPVELTNVTLEQALDIVSLQSKSFWKAVTSNIIFVAPDQLQKRRDYEEQVVRTFYLSNTVLPQDLTEIVTGLRQLLDLKRIQQLNSQNAIIVRDTPDKLALIEKIIQDVDKAKPEIVVDVQVMEARVDRLRDLGIIPGSSVTIGYTPKGVTTTTPTGGTTTTPTTASSVALSKLKDLGTDDFSISMPSATANAILSDSHTKIIQNPQIRILDGQQAKLKIGDRVPVATGSFQAGVGVGAVGGAGLVNPLVNTQFQYIDTGVNIDITPRVHANREVSMKLTVEVSSVTGTSTIGGIDQPIISQRKIEHDVRLHEGEASILGGLVQVTDTKNLKGWPGLQKIPLVRYLFSSEHLEKLDDEILIVLTPHIVRMPVLTAANLRTLSAGTETNVQIRREADIEAPARQTPPVAEKPNPKVPQGATPTSQTGAVSSDSGGAVPAMNSGVPGGSRQPKIHFTPETLDLKPGETRTIAVVADDVKDLFSVSMLLQYNPATISVEEVQHGGFLSGGTQEVALVQRVDKEKGQATISTVRQPNTPGVNGSGTIMGIVVRGVASGTSKLSIVQILARDSQQRPVTPVTAEATLQVQP